MYEVWSIRPANLAYQFSTLDEVADWAPWLIDVSDKGLAELENHALFAGVSFDNPGECVADGPEILEWIEANECSPANVVDHSEDKTVAE